MPFKKPTSIVSLINKREESCPKQQTSQSNGKKGEKLALEYLQQKSLSIITSNQRSKFGEIDIIALESSPPQTRLSMSTIKREKTIVFVEVKYRNNSQFGSPAEYVDARKQAKILCTAEAYMLEQQLHKVKNLNIRFDILAIQPTKWGNDTSIQDEESEIFMDTADKLTYKISWLKNAFGN